RGPPRRPPRQLPPTRSGGRPSEGIKPMPDPQAADGVSFSNETSGRVAAAPAAPTVHRPRGLFASSASSAAMGLYVPATVAVRLLNFAGIIMLAWSNTPQALGLFNNLLLVINVVTPVCSLGLNEAVTRYVPQF